MSDYTWEFVLQLLIGITDFILGVKINIILKEKNNIRNILLLFFNSQTYLFYIMVDGGIGRLVSKSTAASGGFT